MGPILTLVESLYFHSLKSGHLCMAHMKQQPIILKLGYLGKPQQTVP